MKTKLSLLALLLGATGMHAQTNCSNAIPVTAGIHPSVSYAGGVIPQPLCVAYNSNTSAGIWYKYTATENKTVTITTNVPGYNLVDTRLHVYKGDCNNLTCIAGDDDSGGGGYTSMASFAAEAGKTYTFAFDNRWTSAYFHFKLSESAYIPPFEPGMSFTSQSVNISGSYIMGVVDMNNDYLDDIVKANNGSVTILYQAPNNSGFTEATLTSPTTNYMPGWSMAAGDFNKDGYNDLVYGAGSGASLLLSNSTGTGFPTLLTRPGMFCQRTNFVDINNDGELDVFICHDVAPNVHLLNNGNNGFTQHQGGLGDHPNGGNYGSIWVDYDNDGDPDLFLAKCKGAGSNASLNELHRNNGDGTFTNVSVAANLSDMIQTWSTAWGDFDNDGFMDAMVGANSTASGTHKLMRNNGDGTFTDVTAGSGFDAFTSYGREHVAYDFNNDGFIDVMGAGGKIMFNNGNMTFSPVSIPAFSGPVGDLNNDGFLDILNDNVIYFNTGNSNKWIKINLNGTASNKNGIGARVEVYTQNGKQIRDVRSGDGFEFMSTLNAHFGLGSATSITKVVIKWPSGVIDTIMNPPVNQALFVTEGSTMAVTDVSSTLFRIYPNPAKDVIEISGGAEADIKSASLYNLEGRLVMEKAVTDAKISVSQLAKGTYILILHDNSGATHTSKIIKE